MENNEEIKVNTAEVNANENMPKKNNNGKTVIWIIVTIILVLVIGIGGGFLLASKNNNNNTLNKTETPENKQEQTKTSKKIDESKPWVYDAEYGKDKTVKKVESFSSDKYLTVPYININSEDANKANDEIKNIYEEIYSKYGTAPSYTIIYSSNYEFYENDNILSIVLRVGNAVINGGAGTSKTYIYNFNLDTLKTATLKEMAILCGFNSESDVKNKVKGWEKRQDELAKANPDKVAAQMTGVVDGQYFIDKDKKLNFIYMSLAAGNYYTPAVVEPNKDIEDFYEFEDDNNLTIEASNSNSKTRNYNQDNFLFLNAAGLKNVTFESKKDENGYNYRIDFDEKGNHTIKIVLLGEGIGSQVYGTYNNFYDIVQSNNWPESGIETASFKFKDLNGIGSEQNGTIQYSLVTNNETIKLKLSVPYGEQQNKEITLYKASTYIRPDNTNRSSGELTITNFTNESFDFDINATHVNGENIEESIARGGINLGEVSGTAKKLSEGKYQFVPEKDDELMAIWEGEYKINFTVINDSTIEIEEIYDKDNYSQGPYSGGNVRFDGTYTK